MRATGGRFWREVEADARTTFSPVRLAARYLLTPSVSASVLLRGSEALLRDGRPWSTWASRLLRAKLANKHGIHIAEGASLGTVRLPHPVGIVIGPGAVVGDGVALYQGVTIGAERPRTDEWLFPTIEDGATLYANASVIGDIVVGAGATVGAGAVVTRSVPAGATVVGVDRVLGDGTPATPA